MDASLYRRVNRLADHTGWLHGPAVAYAKYGVVLFALFLVWAWLRARRGPDLRAEAGTGWAAIAALLSLGIGQVLGHAVDRARPYTAMPHAHVLVARTSDFSFPSDHALTVGAIAVGLWAVDRTVGRIAMGFALLMAFTRVYVGAHYPADVLAGLLIAGLVALLGAGLATRLLTSVLAALSRLPAIGLLTGRPAGAGPGA